MSKLFIVFIVLIFIVVSLLINSVFFEERIIKETKCYDRYSNEILDLTCEQVTIKNGRLIILLGFTAGIIGGALVYRVLFPAERRYDD